MTTHQKPAVTPEPAKARPKAQPMSDFTMGVFSLLLLFGLAWLLGGLAVTFAAKGSGRDVVMDVLQLQIGR